MTRSPEAPPRRALLLAIFIVCVIVYNANCRLIAAGDSRSARLLPFAILTRGTVVFDSYGPPTPEAHWFTWGRGHLVSLYPIVLPVLATPLFVPAAVYVATAKPDAWRFETVVELMEKAVASVIAALSVVLVFLALRRLTTEKIAILLAAAYAFGTQTWSTSSQAMWQHGLGQVLLASILYLLIRYGPAPRPAFAVGVLCGLTVFNRPANALFAAAIALFYLMRARNVFPRFAFGTVAASLPFLAYNAYYLGRPLGGYQSLVGTHVFEHSIPDGVAALLVSPGKGLFVFAPFFLFLAVGGRRELGAAGRLPIVLLWLACLGQLVLYGTMDWRAGWTYGPRFLSDMLPFLTVALVPAVERLRPAGLATFFACVAFAIFAQAVGAFCFPKGGSYLLSKSDFWKLTGAQFLVEARGGLARPEYLHRGIRWARNRLRGVSPPTPPRRTFFYTAAPCRAVDTRHPTGPFGGPPVEAGRDRTFRLAERCGVPSTARSISLNVTVLGASSPGQLTIFAGDGETAMASAISYRAGAIRANNGIFPLGPEATLEVSCQQNSGGVHVLLDVNGYFE